MGPLRFGVCALARGNLGHFELACARIAEPNNPLPKVIDGDFGIGRADEKRALAHPLELRMAIRIRAVRHTGRNAGRDMGAWQRHCNLYDSGRVKAFARPIARVEGLVSGNGRVPDTHAGAVAEIAWPRNSPHLPIAGRYGAPAE